MPLGTVPADAADATSVNSGGADPPDPVNAAVVAALNAASCDDAMVAVIGTRREG
jgi:hypothetical protein